MVKASCMVGSGAGRGIDMLGLLLVAIIVAISFAAGYWTRSAISSRRRTKYLKWEPYVRPSRAPSQPPSFLMRSGAGNVAQMPRTASGGRPRG
jgi:hypothetical protein